MPEPQEGLGPVKPGAKQATARDEAQAALAVAIDLIAEDAELRRAIPEPLVIRIPQVPEKEGGEPGSAEISVPNITAWPHDASRYAMADLWNTWASRVLSADDYEKWAKADLHNYQIRRIYDAAVAAGGIDAAK